MAEQFGYEVIDPGRFPADTVDFTAILTELRDANAELMFTVGPFETLATIWNTMNQVDYRPKFVMFNRGFHFTMDVITLGGEYNAEGITNHPQWSATFETRSFVTGHTSWELNDLHVEASGQPPDIVVGWDQQMLDIIHAVLLNTQEMTPEGIRNGFRTIDVQTILGRVNFDENGLSDIPSILGQWRAGGNWGLQMTLAGAELVPELSTQGLIPMPWSVR
jgi:branched-chain amino acid transport system substrate-binding protein